MAFLGETVENILRHFHCALFATLEGMWLFFLSFNFFLLSDETSELN